MACPPVAPPEGGWRPALADATPAGESTGWVLHRLAQRLLPLLLILPSPLPGLAAVAEAATVAPAPPAASPAPAAVASPAAPQAPDGARPGSAPSTAPPMTTAELRRLLRTGSLDDLALGCRKALEDDRHDRLRLIRERLLTLLPAPQPLPVVLANADVLLGCHQPEAALTVLERISPAAGAERLQWLLLQWRAANAALDHRRAAIALQRLGASRPERLEALMVPVLQRQDGSVVSRAAIDLLAEHLRARGFPGAAAALLLASRDPGVAGAQRRLEAVRALGQLPPQERENLLEGALEQAAAVGAWGLVADLLDAQADLPSQRAVERRLRLSPRIDDAYGEWLLRRQDPGAGARTAELERLLRSPRSATGHNPAPAQQAAPAAPAAGQPKLPTPAAR